MSDEYTATSEEILSTPEEGGQEAPQEAPQESQGQQEAPESFSRDQVENLLNRERYNLSAWMHNKFQTEQGKQHLLNTYLQGYSKAEELNEAIEEESFDSDTERLEKALRGRIDELESKLNEVQGVTNEVQGEFNSAQIKQSFEQELDDFLKSEQPEYRAKPNTIRAMRRDIFTAISNNPHLGGPGGVARLAREWMKEADGINQEWNSIKTSAPKGRMGGGAVIPSNKKPEEMTDDEIKSAMFQGIFNP